jgi:hypothetical protein
MSLKDGYVSVSYIAQTHSFENIFIICPNCILLKFWPPEGMLRWRFWLIWRQNYLQAAILASRRRFFPTWRTTYLR